MSQPLHFLDTAKTLMVISGAAFGIIFSQMGLALDHPEISALIILPLRSTIMAFLAAYFAWLARTFEGLTQSPYPPSFWRRRIRGVSRWLLALSFFSLTSGLVFGAIQFWQSGSILMPEAITP